MKGCEDLHKGKHGNCYYYNKSLLVQDPSRASARAITTIATAALSRCSFFLQERYLGYFVIGGGDMAGAEIAGAVTGDVAITLFETGRPRIYRVAMAVARRWVTSKVSSSVMGGCAIEPA